MTWRCVRSFLALVVTALALAILGHVLHLWYFIDERFELKTDKGWHEIGHAWQIPLGTTWMCSRALGRSPARLFENGREIGPGNAQHEDIRRVGGGRFSLWCGTLYVSASDNTNPLTNGKTYALEWPRRFSPLELVAAALTALLAMGWGYRNLGRIRSRARALVRLILRQVHRHPESLLPLMLAGGGGLGALFVFWLRHPEALEALNAKATVFVAAGFSMFLGTRLRAEASGAAAGDDGDGGIEGRPEEERVTLWQKGLEALLLMGSILYLMMRPGIIGAFPPPMSLQQVGPILLLCGAFVIGWKGWGKFPGTPLQHVLGLLILAWCIQVSRLLPPLITYWDSSGWMDSTMYDRAAHQIATGENPWGVSYYMPLYQYGMAVIYWCFGHYFWVQQVVNLLLALVTTWFLARTAWTLSGKAGAVGFVLGLGVCTPYLHHAVHYTQIENWFIPLLAWNLYRWARYWRRPSSGNAAWLGLAVGMVLNTRLQGCFLQGILMLTPWILPNQLVRQRMLQCLLIAGIVGVTLLPWTIRNGILENRWTPGSSQTMVQMCITNDPRCGFYGIRYDLNFLNILSEYHQRWPNEAERLQVMKRDAWNNLTRDPLWTAKAVAWRFLAFYGLIPPGIWNKAGPGPTDWGTQWQGYVFHTYWGYFFIFLAVGALLRRPQRSSLFLGACILGALGVIFFAGSGEQRICYPVLLLHILIGMSAFFPTRETGSVQANSPVSLDGATGLDSAADPDEAIPGARVSGKSFALAVLATLVCWHLMIGRESRRRHLMEAGLRIDPKVTEVASGVPELGGMSARKEPIAVGTIGTCRLIVSNNRLPPPFCAFVPEVLPEGIGPTGTRFFIGMLQGGGEIGITYTGARANQPIREGDLVEVEGLVLHPPARPTRPLWLQAQKIVVLESAPESLRKRGR